MKKLRCCFLLFLVILCLVSVSAQALVQKNPMLDKALSMLEQGNMFLERYNLLTGSNIQAVFPLGVPYFYGGQSYDRMMANYPNYSRANSLETTSFFKAGKLYILGFDCAGYADWICESNGLEEVPPLSSALTNYGKYGRNYVFTSNSNVKKPMPDWSVVAQHLQVGDFYIVYRNGSRHILMFIGTLRDYSFTKKEAPLLADYLDYPLVAHCGTSPVFGERFSNFIAENPEFSRCNTTDGGVHVSIIGVPLEAAPFHKRVQLSNFSYFKLPGNGQVMTIFDLGVVSSYCWFRQTGL
ncbi:MAG: hypothetical protein ACOX6G_09445 [Christensenellales bacterium]|jgi:hypothetical protein